MNQLPNKKRVAFNCTTAAKFGGVPKNAALFIERAIRDDSFYWVFFVAESVLEILNKREVLLNKNLYLFESPARSLKARKEIKDKAKELDIDLVYTMAGPAYVHFDCYHVMGISNPYMTHAKWNHFRFGRSFGQSVIEYARTNYRMKYALAADFFVFQTSRARREFCQKTATYLDKTVVISNAFDVQKDTHNKHNFSMYSDEINLSNSDVRRVILCPGADYPHKAFVLIPKIAYALKNLYDDGPTDDMPVFLLTLPFGSKQWQKIQKESEKLNIAQFIQNRGPYNYADITGVMATVQIMFVPSILETFSASYLEAFYFKKPLITSDVEFAREICADAAVYIDPTVPEQSANTIFELLDNQSKQIDLVERGMSRLGMYPNQEERYNQILKVLEGCLE